MDSKAFRLSILAIITTCVLVGVVVYAANRDRIHALIGADNFADSQESVEEISEDKTTEYGEQIGDNLKGFLTADDFFDKSEQRPSVVVVVDNVPVPANAETTEEDTTDLIDMPGEDKSGDNASRDNDSGENNPDGEKPEEEKPGIDEPEEGSLEKKVPGEGNTDNTNNN